MTSVDSLTKNSHALWKPTSASRPAQTASQTASQTQSPASSQTRATQATTAIDALLAERGKRYGSFAGHAAITQDLKLVMQATDRWADLADDQREALEMIAHKIGRILNGDPDYDDSWVDIAGYARLVADRLNGIVR